MFSAPTPIEYCPDGREDNVVLDPVADVGVPMLVSADTAACGEIVAWLRAVRLASFRTKTGRTTTTRGASRCRPRDIMAARTLRRRIHCTFPSVVPQSTGSCAVIVSVGLLRS